MNGMSGRLLGQVLRFIDRPWKAVTVVVLVILVGLGYFAWLERIRIAEAIFESASLPKLRIDTFNADARELLRRTRADIIVLAHVDLVSNIIEDVAGWDRDGNAFIPVVGEQSILHHGQSMEDVVRLMRNEVVCRGVPLGSPETPEWEAEGKIGITRACIVAVPPIVSVTVGVLIIGWKDAPNRHFEEQISPALQRAAMTFASW